MQHSLQSNTEGRILLAINAYKTGQISSLRKAAATYGAPRATVTTRYHGTPERRDSRPASCKLTSTEEEVIIQRILDLDSQGFPPRLSAVREIANLVLVSRGMPLPQTVGKNWPTNFINRCPQLRTIYNRKYDYQRAQCEDPVVVQGWFNLVQNMKQKYGILDEDIYNFDETGFQMGVITTVKVVTGTEKRGRARTVQPGNREWVTVVHGINAKGWAIPPLIILKAKLHQRTWYTNNDIPQDWRLAVSENGWTDDKIGLEWIQHFHKHTQSRTKGQWRLLILDGHGSHHTAQFEEFCKQNYILTLCMPAHSSHILQPLDIGCFSVLKTAYGTLIEKQMRLGINHITKEDFLAEYHIAHEQAITKKNILSGFAASGLIPFDPERVLSTLSPIIRTPSPVPTHESTWESKTPRTIAELKRQAKYIQEQRRLRKDSSKSPSDSAFNQLLKGFESVVHERAILMAENEELRAANKRQKRQQNQRRVAIGTGGTFTISEGQDRIHELQIEEQIQAEVREGEAREYIERPRKRAAPRCSICESLKHNARTCPRR